MPIIIRAVEFVIYSLTYLAYTAAFLCFITSSLGQVIHAYVKREFPGLSPQESEKLVSDIELSQVSLDKVKIALDFLESAVPSNIWMIFFLLFAFLIFFFLTIIFKNQKLGRYDPRVFIIMAFGSIASGVSSLVLLINSLLIVAYLYIKWCTVIDVPILDYMLISMILAYTLLAYGVLNIEKQLSYDFTKNLK
ncbi:hypothetical protein G9F32_01940 [Acinetobacter sp. 194]|uniref:hypothetical protein n=1 Tax=Acinetobacter shaoyimingii TaxID=2715164 RepID=UPI00140AFDD7|nr:hypothetical protein [Acinetobacter shaoyimingii]NHB56799.1 hypothetical protein [Acinetobacter shaoyimingii]